MHGSWQVRLVRVPGQDVEGGRLVAHQVVVDPVVPDQVVRPHPGENRRHRLTVHHPHGPGAPGGEAQQWLGIEHPDLAVRRPIEQRHSETGGADSAVADGRKVVEHGGRRDAARTQPEDMHLARAGDVLHRVQRGDDRPAVGIQVPVPVLLARVAPGDREDLQTLLGGELDQRPARRQIHEVVLVDLRGNYDDRNLLHGRSLRAVLQEFENLIAVDHRALRDRDVLADDELRPVDLRRQAAVVREVGQVVPGAGGEVCAAGLEGAFERGGVAQQRVGRRHSRRHRQREEPSAFPLVPVREVDLLRQPGQRVGRREVALHQPVVGGVPGPGRVAEPPIPGIRRDVGNAGGDPCQLGREPRRRPGEQRDPAETSCRRAHHGSPGGGGLGAHTVGRGGHDVASGGHWGERTGGGTGRHQRHLMDRTRQRRRDTAARPDARHTEGVHASGKWVTDMT